MADNTHLILGFTGGIGRAVAVALSKRNIPIKVLVRDSGKAKRYAEELDNVEMILGDASKPEDLDAVFKDVSVVHYCVNIPYNKWEENAPRLLKNCIDAAVRYNVKLVFPGNVYVYGHAKYNPVDEKHPHAAHTNKGQIRMEMEEMLALARQEASLNYTIVRMPDFYGPFVVNTFSEQVYINAIKGKTMQWIGDLDAEVELIFIEDGGEAMVMAALSKKSDGEVFNIPGASATTARKYLQEIAAQAESKSKPATLNSNLVFSLVGLFNPIVKEVKEMLYLKREKLILSGEKFSTMIGELPVTDYESGIKKTLDWVREYYSL